MHGADVGRVGVEEEVRVEHTDGRVLRLSRLQNGQLSYGRHLMPVQTWLEWTFVQQIGLWDNNQPMRAPQHACSAQRALAECTVNTAEVVAKRGQATDAAHIPSAVRGPDRGKDPTQARIGRGERGAGRQNTGAGPRCADELSGNCRDKKTALCFALLPGTS